MSMPKCQIGYQLPKLDLPLDRTLIVAAAMASQDYEDVHHDPGAAQGRGTPDIFMSINSTNGFIDRYITDWSGPASRIKKTSLRLGVPNFPGDTMTFTGEVTTVDGDAVTVKVIGSNARGPHVTATVTVEPTPQQGEST
ncbi:acyl dehydratase [Rhodococcus sp. PAMC28707]|uniref:MaoC/PaaZ C-terminal domain-containing protein n=1 Tax=unclassified Rhodococcus (in: high G+C Gram-positive bacteria) TaxID=192944 RepID=UPI00109DE919|nr:MULTISPECIES: MaoC/PaaZ C-terminal domain-containing protein [unclassified Rhodococcus (in: high G+C Gram-positive bacteria)]QCB51415.1 acyl dehydratase [Rhodococcus sp. PAMC28705]QCB60417.1 acyl dehydratase [Rhodococcus sp. PAMC28707]